MKTYRSELIYKLKGIAIISVVCAHCGNRISYTFVDTFLNDVRGNIATIGVPLFFIISGYLFHTERPYIKFWKSKWYSTIVPWVFWGTLIWAYEVIRKGLDYARLSDWLLGIGTYLWYMRTLVIFWAVLYSVKTYKQKLWIFIASVVSRVILYDIMQVSISSTVVGDILLNLPFFTFGMLLVELDIIKIRYIFKKCYFFAPVLIMLPLYINNHQMSYSPPLFLMYVCGCLLIALVLIHKSERYAFLTNKLVLLGKDSYLIYLIHMPFAGLMSNLFSRNEILLYFVLVQPIIVLVVSEYFIKVLQMFCNKYKVFSFMTGQMAEKK